jgi:hypothetical protein
LARHPGPASACGAGMSDQFHCHPTIAKASSAAQAEASSGAGLCSSVLSRSEGKTNSPSLLSSRCGIAFFGRSAEFGTSGPGGRILLPTQRNRPSIDRPRTCRRPPNVRCSSLILMSHGRFVAPSMRALAKDVPSRANPYRCFSDQARALDLESAVVAAKFTNSTAAVVFRR